MTRHLLALCATLILITVVACGDDTNDNPNPCEQMDCGKGNCNDNNGVAVCNCNANYYPDSAGKCSWHFDTTEYLAYGEVCPTSSGKVEVKGVTGTYSGYNGYYADVPAGAFDKCVLVLLAPAVGTNLPSPGKPGKIVSTAHGLEVVAVDKLLPLKADGNLNEVKILKEADVFFAKHRGQVLFFNSTASKFEDVVKYTFTSTGSLGVTKHLSPFYLLDSTPVLTATATHKGSGLVELDFTGTKDENDGSSYMLTFSATGDGTPLTLTAVTGKTHKFTSTLAGGTYKITAKVTDPYKGTDTKVITLNVDLCANVQCKAWETCRVLDGKCIGTDPCSPSPCKNGGTCDSGTGSAKCTCTAPWSGPTCEVKDLCWQVSCNGHGTCNATTGKCVCSGNWDSSKNCASCLPGWKGSTCTDKDLCYGVTCGTYGSCQSATGACACTAGYAGAKCDTCDTNYGPAYPVCNPKPTITGLKVDCSKHSGWCTTGETYPLSWNSANATSYTSFVKITSGCSKDPGKVNPAIGPTTSSTTSIYYTLGKDCGPASSEITITVTGTGGSASATYKVDYY